MMKQMMMERQVIRNQNLIKNLLYMKTVILAMTFTGVFSLGYAQKTISQHF